MVAKPSPLLPPWILDREGTIYQLYNIGNIAFPTLFVFLGGVLCLFVCFHWTLIKPLLGHSLILLGQLLWVVPYMVGSLNLMIMYPLLYLFQQKRRLKYYIWDPISVNQAFGMFFDDVAYKDR